jgi:S-adenosylmethionine:tRNA ribosyltransferase-isomerase
LKTRDFDYNLPPDRIAQTPIEPRDTSRLLVLDRKTGKISHTIFNRVGEYLYPGDLLVINKTRVIPARLFAHKADTGGKVELLLLKQLKPQLWEVLVGGKRMTVGKKIILENGVACEIVKKLSGARRLVRFATPLKDTLDKIGNVPLPPYIHTKLEEPERYQTVYASQSGSAAAPTAGLHFTPELIKNLKSQGIGFAEVTLHIGLDTFAPVTEEDPTTHEIHTEWCRLDPKTARRINRVHEGRVIAVGTTSVRTLETAGQITQAVQRVAPVEGPTDLFILPGYQFKVVDVLLTNFHLPRSTLLMLVSAFAGHQQIMKAYKAAIEKQYRFYSFGDAMLIL